MTDKDIHILVQDLESAQYFAPSEPHLPKRVSLTYSGLVVTIVAFPASFRSRQYIFS